MSAEEDFRVAVARQMLAESQESEQLLAQRLRRIEREQVGMNERLDDVVRTSAKTCRYLGDMLQFFTRTDEKARQAEIDKAYQQGYADGAGAEPVEPKTFTGLRVVEGTDRER